jgi:hypothetical protein
VRLIVGWPSGGYTLFLGTSNEMVLNPYEKKPYNTLEDFAPITMVISFPSTLVVHPSTREDVAAVEAPQAIICGGAPGRSLPRPGLGGSPSGTMGSISGGTGGSGIFGSGFTSGFLSGSGVGTCIYLPALTVSVF